MASSHHSTKLGSDLYSKAKESYIINNKPEIIDNKSTINTLCNNVNTKNKSIYSLPLTLIIDKHPNSFNKNDFIQQFAEKFKMHGNKIKIKSISVTSVTITMDIWINIYSKNTTDYIRNIISIKQMISEQSHRILVKMNICLIKYEELIMVANNMEYMIYILDSKVFSKMNNSLTKYRNDIINYFNQYQINSEMILIMEKSKFINDLLHYINTDKSQTNLTQSINNLYKIIIETLWEDYLEKLKHLKQEIIQQFTKSTNGNINKLSCAILTYFTMQQVF